MVVTVRTSETVMEALVMISGSAAETMIRLMIASTHLLEIISLQHLQRHTIVHQKLLHLSGFSSTVL